MTYGSGANGCLGHGNNNDVPQTKAKIVEALLGCEVTLISAGATHVMALTNDHDLFAWGRGDNGRLGFEVGSEHGGCLFVECDLSCFVYVYTQTFTPKITYILQKIFILKNITVEHRYLEQTR